jgi:hypothetical protein
MDPERAIVRVKTLKGKKERSGEDEVIKSRRKGR